MKHKSFLSRTSVCASKRYFPGKVSHFHNFVFDEFPILPKVTTETNFTIDIIISLKFPK